MRTEIRGRSPNPVGDGALTPLFAALAVAAQIVLLDLTYPLAQPFATLWHLLAYASLTLFLWIATRGRRPFAVPLAVIAFGALAQDAFPAAVAASAIAAILFVLQGKLVCAESSPR
jgi:hypothetical protein